MTTESSSTLRAQQFEFARHLRDPASNPPPPGIADRRLELYRELFYNNIEALLADNFPVIRKTSSNGEWHALIRAFHAGHRCRTPLFAEIGREFIRFLESRDAGAHPPWLLELAHYEWVELALEIADEPMPAHDAGGDLLRGVPILSPLAWPLAYRWPVQMIGPNHRPDKAPEQPTLLLVRRDALGAVHFSAISPLVYRLLQLLDETPAPSGREALTALSREASASNRQQFVEEGAAMLKQLRDEGTILGTLVS
ncbi:MAG: putative DNA-binding domain-containing protein [Luteimonas sp.]